MLKRLILVLPLFIIGCSSPSPEELAERNCNDPIMAHVMAEKFVTRSLKSPATADFASYNPKNVSYIGDCKHRVSSYVDAQNGFGALVRTNFTVEVQYNKASDNYSLINIRTY